jgi:hypothetical protein
LLADNATKAAREQLTLIRIFEELRERGYDGGYDAVRRYARRWAKERGETTAAAYVPLSFAPGEAYQLPAVCPIRRPAPVPPRQPALRAHIDHRHHQPLLR